ncbi:MAG: hypothetical protein JXQ90_09895 [Cyclobacteriaceae bacterium]
MKLLEPIRQLKFTRLIVEAVLIFSSVYAAFLLEDKRSKRFERELLQQKLLAHLKVMEVDSITFETRLLGQVKSDANDGLKTSVALHKEALELLENRTESAYLEVYELHKSGRLFWRIIQSATKSQHKLEAITENYDHLIINDSTRHLIEKYIYHTWVLNRFAANSDQHIDDLSNFAREHYFVFSVIETKKDIIEFISHPYYYNSLKSHLNTLQILFTLRKDYFEDFSKIKVGIEKEVALQNTRL